MLQAFVKVQLLNVTGFFFSWNSESLSCWLSLKPTNLNFFTPSFTVPWKKRLRLGVPSWLLSSFIGEKEVIIACTVAFVGLAGTGMLDKSANSIAFPGELETAILMIYPLCYHVLLRFTLLRMLACTRGTSCALALDLERCSWPARDCACAFACASVMIILSFWDLSID